MTELTLFSKHACVQCVATKRHLENHSMAFAVRDIAKDESALAEAQALGYSQAPVVKVEVDGVVVDHWSGFRPDKLATWQEKLSETASPALVAV